MTVSTTQIERSAAGRSERYGRGIATGSAITSRWSPPRAPRVRAPSPISPRAEDDSPAGLPPPLSGVDPQSGCQARSA
jgi:hypothetical protein